MKHFEGNFEGIDGTKLYYQAWLPDGEPKAVIQIVHGFGEHSGRYGHVINELIPKGYALYADDHRGHGKSEGLENYAENMDQYVEDEKKFYDLIKEKHTKLPIFMLGHSMGSGITQYFSKKYPDLLKGIILSGSGTLYGGKGVPGILKALSKVMAKVAPKFTANSGLDPSLMSHDKEEVKKYVEDPLVHSDRGKARQAAAMFTSFKKLPEIIKQIKIPALYQKGLADEVVAGWDQLRAALTADNMTVKEYEGLYHEIYNEIEKDRKKVLKDLSDWLEAQV